MTWDLNREPEKEIWINQDDLFREVEKRLISSYVSEERTLFKTDFDRAVGNCRKMEA